MKPTALVAVVASLIFAPGIRAQTSDIIMPHPTAACRPTPTLDELVKAIDEAVSGPVDKDRTCLRELLLPEAHLVPTTRSADGTYSPHPLTVDGWIDRVKARGGSVYEHQVKVTTETYGHIAHLWSTYEVRTAVDGPVQVRGINSIQALNDGKRWRIYQIFWQAETTDEKIPEKYLP